MSGTFPTADPIGFNLTRRRAIKIARLHNGEIVRAPRRLIRLLSFPGDVVMDPFCGSGTTALAASQLGRQFYGFDKSSQYVASALRRVVQRGAAA